MTKPISFTIYEINMRPIREIETRANAIRRKQVAAANGNCLLCKHTKVAVGKRLICRLKDKLVTQYNYCEKFVETKPEGDNDD